MNSSPIDYLSIVKYPCINHCSGIHQKITKNLGWIRKHGKEIRAITIFPYSSGDSIFSAVFTACLIDGRVYRTCFRDINVLVELIARWKNISHITCVYAKLADNWEECQPNKHYCIQRLELKGNLL